MRPLIKEVQYHQFIALIDYAICDNNCETCDWKNNGNYNFAEYACLLMELRDLIPKQNEESDLSKLDYLKRKE